MSPLVKEPRRGGRRRLRIGLLNNLGDSALATAEAQFEGLLAEAGTEFSVELRLFALPAIERGERAREQMRGRYADAGSLAGAGLDGLIVTGAEPRTASLEDEPYWDDLRRVVDWTEAARVPTVWSCLAAHAAVLHQAGVRRRPLAEKLSGVFPCAPASDHPLAEGLSHAFWVPHSRWNDLAEADLVSAGYEILSRSPTAGVDAFLGPSESASLYFQGHPEYEADSLLREYGRDLGRFFRNGGRLPAMPAGYLDAESEQALERLTAQARLRSDPALLPAFLEILDGSRPVRRWRPAAVAVYRAWLGQAADAGADEAPLGGPRPKSLRATRAL
ncbi:MAG: homoserine O-succinyltransferase [Caulobacteraceae bacterium]|nr:homoserine O-succinyltransferase [Caulobacteraceae bacterium]